MKKLILSLFFIFTISFNYSQESSVEEITKTELINIINQAKKDGKISDNPVIVVDKEIILDFDRLNIDQKFFRKIGIVQKGKIGMIKIYGKNAINGIIMIESIPENPEGQDIKNSDIIILYFIEKKEVRETEFKKLNPDSIQNVQVIKSKKEIAKYTDKECDKIFIINLKKQK